MFRLVTLPNTIKGKLFLHSMPGAIESWNEFEQFAQITKLDYIVCLTDIEEIEKYSPDYAKAIANKTLPCTRIEYIIISNKLPHEKVKFRELVHTIAIQIQTGKSVLIHCHHGISRTGFFANCVLEQLGLHGDQAALLIFKAGAIPRSQRIINAYLNSKSTM